MIIEPRRINEMRGKGWYVLECPYFDDHAHAGGDQDEVDKEIMGVCYEKAPDRKIGRPEAFGPNEFDLYKITTVVEALSRMNSLPLGDDSKGDCLI